MKTKSSFSYRLMSLLLVALMVFTMLPTAALAADTETTEEHTHEEIVVETEAVTADAADAETEAVAETDAETEEVTAIDTTEETSAETETVEETGPYSGVIGESAVAWKFDTSTGRLTISGSGDCTDFTSAADQPWAMIRTEITEVWFYDMDALAVSDLAYWFDGCTALTMAEIPYTTPVIGTRAFADCPALRTVLIYHDGGFSITNSAFAVDTLTAMEIRYIPSSEATTAVLTGYDWTADNRAVFFEDVYGISLLATGYCSFCDGTYSYTLDYEQWTDSVHCVRHWCSNCGYDQCGGVLGEDHTYSGGYCTKCGYGSGSSGGGGDDDDCSHGRYYTDWYGCDWYEYCYYCDELMDYGTSHGSTYTEWSGCDWYEYCSDCDELMDSGTSHGTYSYGDWEYYNSSRHRRYYSCNDCGEGSYSYGYHSTSTEYTEYSSSQHKVGSYCSTCESYIGSTSYESHSFTYSSWSNYSSTQHRRIKTCSACGYSTYEYGSHALTYSGWTSYNDSQHRRSVSCSTCSYSGYEYEDHALTTGEWTASSDSVHTRTKACSCGYSTTEAENHVLEYGAWENHDDSQHRRSVDCACGYSSVEYAEHTMTAGEWVSVSDTQHSRENTCVCSHTETEYGDHADTDEDGYCDHCDYLMTRFSVTIPASMVMTVSEDGEIHTADNVVIVNYSTGAVEVTGVTVTAAGDWTLVPYDYNMAAAKVDTKLIGFSLNGAETTQTGDSENLSLLGNWIIGKGAALPLTYDAVVSATSTTMQNEQVLTLVFVIDWAS